MQLLVDLHFLPSLEYFCVLQQFDKIVLEKHEHYIKQSYRNRCYINTAQGVEMLVVPLTSKHGKVPVKDIRIDYSQKWQNNHWRTIESAYRKAPYFEYYAEDLESILYSDHEFLFDLNFQLLSFCLKCIKHKVDVSVTVSYEKLPLEGIFDLRGRIEAKKPYSARPFYTPRPYYQVFGNAFAENLSLIDLLFCEGPGATSVLQTCRKENLNK